MSSEAKPGHGFQVAPEDLAAQAAALSGIGERTNSLVTSANQLAERLPMLGTSPPAMHLAMRLREEAGHSGLTGEITSADSELKSFHTALNATATGYLDTDANNAQELLNQGGAET